MRVVSYLRTTLTLGFLVALSGCATLGALGWTAAEHHRVRGTIAEFSGSTLAVDTREGTRQTVEFGIGWQVVGVVPASLADVEPGDFVGIASLPTADGRDGALELMIFPDDMAGYDEGTYPWDLEPGSSMTNGTVSNAVQAVDGNELTLTFPAGERTITVPPDVPVVTLVDAELSDLKPGAGVFVPGRSDGSGDIYAFAVVVGLNGLIPPM